MIELPDRSTRVTAFRGSRKHILDWVTHAGFRTELNAMLALSGVAVGPSDRFMPTGFDDAGMVEAQLHRFGPALMPSTIDWAELNRWWLAAPHGANTPNWDLAATASLNGRPALVLVEAKANVPELSAAGKARPVGKDGAPASKNSWRNHSHIAQAIAEAETALNAIEPGFSLSRDMHYQLSNRIAFSWKLGSLGLPTVLVYLGFTGDTGILDAGPMFATSAQWNALFNRESAGVLPPNVLDRWIAVGPAAFMILVRSRPCLTPSDPLSSKGAG